MINDVKADLPTWPDEIVEHWLANLATRPDLGWPPPIPYGWNSWKYILADRPLAWWRNVDWHLEVINFERERLATRTRGIVDNMSAAHTNVAVNEFSALSDSRDRFDRAFQFICQHGAFPRPIIGMRIETGFYVLDGNHRLTAYAVARRSHDRGLPSCEQQAWVAIHRDGEVFAD